MTYRLFSRFPVIFSKASGSAAALSSLYVGAVALAIILLITALLSKYQRGNIIDTAGSVFGSFGKYILATVIILQLVLSAVAALGEFSRLSKLIAFPTAPFWFLLVFFAIGAVCGALDKLNGAARLHFVFVPLILVIIATLIISTLWRGNAANLFPVLGKGSQAIFGDGLSGLIMYTDIVLLFLIKPSTKENKKIFKSVSIAAVIGVLTNVLFMLAFNISISYPVSVEGQFPIYLLLKEVYYGRFFQRIDAILLLASALSGMLYLSLNTALFSSVAKQLFKNASYKALVLAYWVVVFTLTLLSDLLSAKTLTCLIFIFGFGGLFIVLLCSGFSAIRRKSNEKT